MSGAGDPGIEIHGQRIAGAEARAWQLALALGRQRRFAEAIIELQRILAHCPHFLPAAIQAAHFLSGAGRHREAVIAVLQATKVPGASPALAIEIGKLLRRFECPRELSELFERVDWEVAGSAVVLVEAGRLLAESGLHDQAVAMLERAERIQPDYPHLHYLRGSLHATAGEMASARDEFRRTLALSPRAPHAHWMLSMVPGEDESDAATEGDVATLEALLGQAAPGSDARAYLGHALHNHLHRLGRHDQAWDALDQGRQARRARVPYDAIRQAELFDALHAVDLGALRPGHAPPHGSPGLVFIVGMHRSGTTLLERVLAGHRGIIDGGETHAFGAQLQFAADHECARVVDTRLLERIGSVDLAEVADRFRDYARWRVAGGAMLTEKLPENFLLAGIIARALPEARILHMRRDPVDTCFSNLRTFFGGAAAHSYDPLDLAKYYLQYRRLMAHWHEVAPGRILDIDYAAFVADPEAETRQVARFCGIGFEPGSLDMARSGGRVATASIGSVRSGIQANRAGAWRPYASRLQAMIRALEPAYTESGDKLPG